MISQIADLMVELSKESQTEDPARDLYTVHMEVAMEIGKRMKAIREAQREEGKLK